MLPNDEKNEFGTFCAVLPSPWPATLVRDLGFCASRRSSREPPDYSKYPAKPEFRDSCWPDSAHRGVPQLAAVGHKLAPNDLGKEEA